MFDPGAFAREWTAAWSRRDVDAVLSHYADEAVFTSPKAQTIVGRARLEGREPLAQYWRAAMARIPQITFELDTVVWDDARRTLTIIYEADLAGARTRASEVMRFDDRFRIVEGEAFYGAALP